MDTVSTVMKWTHFPQSWNGHTFHYHGVDALSSIMELMHFPQSWHGHTSQYEKQHILLTNSHSVCAGSLHFGNILIGVLLVVSSMRQSGVQGAS